ncbi:penicillin-insensitive murein endopeptidase [Rugamonas sp. CCM 8940]|uniref:penicillin-insensitive murein endopeptidase n=1 Tax=Rugamonas sp. CCM 8940 TaxID=2765359 RepID=UPI0018F33DF6|nr:penicillin-insensitive murein endopeptidase [Rugamonas sp. CCM 8940]MBJ7313071.1 penicillin-insensitive murein endopeptidase [Rugamonas sp. CCM 8940]
MGQELELQPQDSRHYFMLPQAPQDAGYYTYGQMKGKPSNGAYQYATASMITAILWVEREWQTMDGRKFGVGDISLTGGLANKDHKTHRSGLEVDIRPMRKDGKHEPCRWWDAEYDHDATEKLIELFCINSPVILIYFNGPNLPVVRKWPKHDDHFHLQLVA